MGFDAATVASPLDWNFRPYTEAEGIIDEPTDKQIAAFMHEIKDTLKKVAGDIGGDDFDPENPLAMLAALDTLDLDKVTSIVADMAAPYSRLCSGHPTAAQINKLPMRRRQLFYAWLMREVMSPEAVPAAGMRPVSALPRAVGG